MATTYYFEEELHPTNEETGNPDMEKVPTTVAIFVSNFFGKHQIFLRITDENGKETSLPLSKELVQSLHDSIDRAGTYLGYMK